jgi:hypothetical protein
MAAEGCGRPAVVLAVAVCALWLAMRYSSYDPNAVMLLGGTDNLNARNATESGEMTQPAPAITTRSTLHVASAQTPTTTTPLPSESQDRMDAPATASNTAADVEPRVRRLQDALRYFLAHRAVVEATSRDDSNETAALATARQALRDLTPARHRTCDAARLERTVLNSEGAGDSVSLPWCWLPMGRGLPEFRAAEKSGFQCIANRSRPLIATVSRGGKRVRKKLFEQGCGAKYPASDARPMPNRSYIFINERPPPSPSAVALLVSGQNRRFSVSGPSHVAHIVRPNRAHVYVATWPIPEDSIDRLASGPYVVGQLKGVYGDALRAARIEMLSPRLGLTERMASTRYMFYLMEAVTRLALSNPAQSYEFFFRARVDLVFSGPVIVHQSGTTRASTAEADAAWSLSVNGKRIGPFKGATFVAHGFTWCCMNDWFAVGPVAGAMELHGFVYSFAAMSTVRTHVSVPPLGGVNKSASRQPTPQLPPPVREVVQMGYGSDQCSGAGEACLAKALSLSGVAWQLANIPITIGADEPKVDTSRGSPLCPKNCPVL